VHLALAFLLEGEVRVVGDEHDVVAFLRDDEDRHPDQSVAIAVAVVVTRPAPLRRPDHEGCVVDVGDRLEPGSQQREFLAERFLVRRRQVVEVGVELVELGWFGEEPIPLACEPLQRLVSVADRPSEVPDRLHDRYLGDDDLEIAAGDLVRYDRERGTSEVVVGAECVGVDYELHVLHDRAVDRPRRTRSRTATETGASVIRWPSWRIQRSLRLRGGSPMCQWRTFDASTSASDPHGRKGPSAEQSCADSSCDRGGQPARARWITGRAPAPVGRARRDERCERRRSELRSRRPRRVGS
jgi:hypothetical protein